MFNLEESEIINKSIQIISDKWKKEAINIANARVAKDFCILHAAGLEHESFGVLFLNTKHTLIHFEYMFRGTLTEGAVYPREIARDCLKHNAAAIIVTHNHPSGNPEPSREDINITKQLVKVVDLINVRLLDHIVVGGSKTVSLAERGLL